MSFWILFQVIFFVLIFACLAYYWMKLHMPVKDDPRLSRGLQLLQSKIAVLEDLSDRTDEQVRSLQNLLEKRCVEMKKLLVEAEDTLARIDESRRKSLEIAEVFEETIPHQKILERQNLKKYVQAARLANQGVSPEEIAQSVDLTRGEIEMISHVHKDQLQFSEEDLPGWVEDSRPAIGINHSDAAKQSETLNSQNTYQQTQDIAKIEFEKLGEEFKKALASDDMSTVAKNIRRLEFPRV